MTYETVVVTANGKIYRVGIDKLPVPDADLEKFFRKARKSGPDDIVNAYTRLKKDE